jgi:hypothetical protein
MTGDRAVSFYSQAQRAERDSAAVISRGSRSDGTSRVMSTAQPIGGVARSLFSATSTDNSNMRQMPVPGL